MRASPNRKTLSALAAALLVLASAPAAAQYCPKGSHEVSRTRDGDRLIVRCACDEGLIVDEGQCRTVQEALDFLLAADLERQLLLLETGDAFRGGDDLRRRIARASWPVLDKVHAVLATFLGEIGRYRDGAAAIGQVRRSQPTDQVALTIEVKLTELAQRQAAQPLVTPEARDIERELKISHLSLEGRTDVMLGLISYREGEHREAMDYLARAQKLHPDDAGVRDLMFLVSRVQAARAQQPNAGANWTTRVFQRQGALAAWNLGLLLIEGGQAAQADVALGEARERMLRAGAQPGDFNLELIGGLQRRVRGEGTAGMTAPSIPRIYDGTSKADLMLDALEYGQKSWTRSLRFLEIAMTAAPDNSRIREAYNELSLIAANAK